MQSDQSQTSVRVNDLQTSRDLTEEGKWDAAYDVAYKWLKVDPSDADALNIIAYILLNANKPAVAYAMLKYLTTIAPRSALAWLNMGMACNDLWLYNEAVRAYKKGIRYAVDDAQRSMMCVNMASLMVDHGQFRDAEPYCLEAIEREPDTIKGKANLGFCQLAQRNWAEGWKNYRYCIETESRPFHQYNDEPLWDGEGKGKIIVCAEQGLGDEISFGQMIPDMQDWCDNNDSQLIVEVHPRLGDLFKRSFPDIEIHGTRSQRRVMWNGVDIKYSLPMAQLGEYFRTKDEDFTGKPYLKADPDRVLQWEALFKTKKKPVIGIAWRGGVWKTAAKFRQLNLEQLLPVLKSVDAHWVSLQYKPAGKEIEAFKEDHPEIDIVEYSHCTLSSDYDDTVAMIATMDMVICMQTTVVHVAGGLGIPCWTFVPKSSQWRYGEVGEDFPWASSVRIIRQTEPGQWTEVMEKTGEELANYAGISTAAADHAPEDKKLRQHREEIRGVSGPDGRCNGDRPPA